MTLNTSRNEAARAITAKVNEVLALARSLYPSHYIATPTMSYDLRGRTCGGRAYGSRALKFNLDWYMADPTNYLNVVVPHEVAHIVAAATGLGRGHDRGWVRICLALGGDGQRCSSIPTVAGVAKARRTREFHYMTDIGREFWVGAKHHNKLQQFRGVKNPVNGKPHVALRTRTDGRIYAEGFTGRERLAA